MSDTKPTSETPLDTPDSASRWPVWKLALLFYPFTVAAVAVNLFMLGLVARMFDAATLSPVAAILWSIPIGIPATWAAGRWIYNLMGEAES